MSTKSIPRARTARKPTPAALSGPPPVPSTGLDRALRPTSDVLTKELPRLDRLRLSLDRREEIIATLVGGMQQLAPGFARRPMRWRDVERTCRRERIQLRWQERSQESSMLRNWTVAWGQRGPVITLRPRLSREATIFNVFVQLTHWLGHGFDWEVANRLNVDGSAWREALTLGYLALFPHRAGRPYPIFLRYDRLEQSGTYRLNVWHPTRRRSGSVSWDVRREDVEWYPPLARPLPEDKPWFADGGEWS